MTVVAVLGEKGGTGKTTFAANLAGMRANAGRSVLMIDADRQGSSSYWAAERARIEDVAAVDCIQQYGWTGAQNPQDGSVVRRHSD